MIVSEETHPNWYHPIPAMKLLVLGTFPPHEDRRDYEFYYPNKQNRFWRIMAKLDRLENRLLSFEGDSAVLERQKMMERLSIGVENLAERILRKGRSALDENIEIIEFRPNLKKLITGVSGPSSILLTGYSGKTSTFRSFVRFLNENSFKHDAPKDPRAAPYFTIFSDRAIRCWIGNSTSTTAFSISEEKLIQQFRDAWEYGQGMSK